MIRLFVAAYFVVASSLSASAQEKEKEKDLTIRWFGQSFFQVISSSGTKIVFDPHAMTEYDRPTCVADIVCISHEHNDHNRLEILTDSEKAKVFHGVTVKGKAQTFTKIDEQVKDVKIRTVPSYHDEENGLKRGKNAIFCVEVDGLKIVHLGDLGHPLDEQQVKAIGAVDILMIPVGGVFTINGETAKEIVKQLKPRLYILPMHYGTAVFDVVQEPKEFLDGQKNVRELKDGNTLLVPIKLKLDTPTIVMMNWK
jgi:L-ascorbate metabolism protein UlaG (beta-lactamase superfamily)